jgi:hypothetical protein
MNRLSRILLLLPFTLVGTTLSRGADPEPPGTTPYYPLAVGNTWIYKVGENRFALKVTKMEKVKADKKEVDAAKLELIVNDKSVSFEHIGVTADALVRYTFEGKPATPPIPFLKLPPKKGATWKIESKVDGQVLKGDFVAGEEKQVKVPAGVFNAVTVTGKDLEVNGVKLTLVYYFAEKVGMIKQVIEFAGQKAIIELERFEPAK